MEVKARITFGKEDGASDITKNKFYRVVDRTDKELQVVNDNKEKVYYPIGLFEIDAEDIEPCPTAKLLMSDWFFSTPKWVATNSVQLSNNKKSGEKTDSNKLPMSIVIQRQFPNALKAVAECSQLGHKKYEAEDLDWCNLHRVSNGVERYSNAMMRHFLEAGSDFSKLDEETKLEHIKHTVWNALSMLELIEQHKNRK